MSEEIDLLPEDFAKRVLQKARRVKQRRRVSGSVLALALVIGIGVAAWHEHGRAPVANDSVLALDEASWEQVGSDDPGVLLMPSDVDEDDGVLIAMGGDELLSE